MTEVKSRCTSIFNKTATLHCSDELLGESLKVLAEDTQNLESSTKELGYYKDGKAAGLRS